MPRLSDGTFQRFNDQYYGFDVWSQDLATDKKIIALRHDVHDEDLAVGISQCLPKDGAEPMLGHLQMGGFNIRNMANAPNLEPQTAATFGQTVTQATFNNATRLLTLTREGMTDLAVTIPTDGDSNPIDVGVNELIMGTGLQLLSGEDRVNPANPQDTILLGTTGVLAGSYSNASIIVDAQGRITQASNGTALTVDLGTSQGTEFTTITNTGGDNAFIFPAIATGEPSARSGLMSAAQAKQLADAAGAVATDLSIGSIGGNFVNLRSSTQTGGDLSLPVANGSIAGIIDNTIYDAIFGAGSGDPDQTLSIGTLGAAQVDLNLSAQAGTQTVSLPMVNTAQDEAGLMTVDQAKQISGLRTDGSGLTQAIDWTPIVGSQGGVNLTDHIGSVHYIGVWSNPAGNVWSGLFSGIVTATEPVGTAGVPDHHVWFVY